VKGVFLLLGLAVSIATKAKSIDSLGLYFNTGINYNFSPTSVWESQFGSYIYNYPGKVQGFDALNEDEFTENKRSRALKYKLPINFQIGVSKELDRMSKINIELGYGNILKSSTDYSGLRFSDMVSGQGYTSSSRFGTNRNYFSYEVGVLSIGYERAISLKQNLSVMFGVMKLVRSTYHLNIVDLLNSQEYDFSSQDITYSDGFINPFLGIRYSYELTDGSLKSRVFGEFNGLSRTSKTVIETGNLSLGFQVLIW
jgi:hypothetical protein